MHVEFMNHVHGFVSILMNEISYKYTQVTTLHVSRRMQNVTVFISHHNSRGQTGISQASAFIHSFHSKGETRGRGKKAEINCCHEKFQAQQQ